MSPSSLPHKKNLLVVMILLGGLIAIGVIWTYYDRKLRAIEEQKKELRFLNVQEKLIEKRK